MGSLLRFAKNWFGRIAVETVASVIAALLLVGLGAVTNVLDAKVPVWLLLVACAVLLGTLIMLSSRRGRARRRLFLIMPAFRQKDWFAKLLEDLLQVLERSDYDLVVKLPIRDFDAHSMTELMRDLERHRHEYSGGFVIAARPWQIENDLRAFCRKIDVPVVFLDVPPFPSGGTHPPNSSFVGYSATQIGVVAAEYVAKQFKILRKRSPKILVIASQSQSERQASFTTRINEMLPGAQVEVTTDGDFSRDSARRAWLRHSVDDNGRLKNHDAIFCTNDEMALGVVDALEESGANNSATGPWVIGVDGTEEARAVIDRGGLLKASVVQESAQVAGEALSYLNRMFDGDPVEERQFSPRLYERSQRH
jgi:ribose transport system substrate-binding protein